MWIESPVLANQDGTFFVLHYHVCFPHFCIKVIDKQTYYDYEQTVFERFKLNERNGKEGILCQGEQMDF